MTQHACALVELRAPQRGAAAAATDLALITFGGFGGNASDGWGGAKARDDHNRMSKTLSLRLGPSSRADAWGWSNLRQSGTPLEARMGHRLLAPNSSCLVSFGGNAKGHHLNEVLIGTPNRKFSEAEMDAQQRALDAAEEETDEPPVGAGEDEAEMVVVSTRRTADKKSTKGKKKKKKARAAEIKEEL